MALLNCFDEKGNIAKGNEEASIYLAWLQRGDGWCKSSQANRESTSERHVKGSY